MKISDITSLGDGVYELEKGFSNRKLRNGDLVKLQLGGIETAPDARKLMENDDLYLPSSLEDKMMIIFADYDGSYEDHRRTRQHIPRTILRAVRRMKVGQKVLIVEEDDGKDREESHGNAGKGKRIWVVKVLDICEGHLSFGQNVAVYTQSRGTNGKRITSRLSQRIGEKVEEPRLEAGTSNSDSL